MKLLERILVAIDARRSSKSTVAEATMIAKKFHSEVTLLHVLPSEQAENQEIKQYLRMAREGLEARMAQYKEEMVREGVKVGEVLIVEGTPFDQIIRHAEELDVNVVVLGASVKSGATGNGNLGFTAERVCRKSAKPVWVVHPQEKTRKQAILCPVDLSPPSRRALRNAIHLARWFGAKLTVLHVVRPLSTLIGLELPSDSKGRENYFNMETKRFHAFLKEFDFHDVEKDFVSVFGDPGPKILEVARELQSQLIVMGSVGRTGLAKILMGGVAGTVLRDLPCSVVMMKATEAIRLKMEEHLTDIRSYYTQGLELMENGFAEESIRQFKHCISTNEMFLPAWEALAQAYERIGETERAEKTRQTSAELEEVLSWRRVEADVRSHRPLWKSKYIY